MSARPERPFPGLLPFASGSPWLFGRSRDIRRVVNHVGARPLTVVFGPSGAGKSSLLRAGVVPALHANREGADVVLCERWAAGPVASLRRAFGVPDDATLTPAEFIAARAAGGRLITVLDQFEELFVRGDALAPDVADLVATLLEHGRVVISLREDALAVLKHLEREVFRAFDGLLRIDHLTLESGREAITGPIGMWNAEVAPATIDDELVDAVIEGVATRKEDGGKAIRTPQLQIVMVRLWDKAGAERRLTPATLRALGGTDAIIREHVDGELAGYLPSEQRIAGGMLRRMVTPSGAKIAHRLTDLAEFAGTPESVAVPVLAKLTSGSHIVEALEDDRYQLSHDALAVPVLEWCRRLDLREARRQARWRLFFTVGFVTVILMALVLADAFAPIESYTVGAAFELRGTRRPPPNVVLVGVDDATLNAHLKSELPINRRHYASALDHIIAGRPRAVAFDIYFPKRPTSSRDYQALAESVYGADRPVVFTSPLTAGGKTDVFGGFVKDLGATAGLDSVREDAGGVVRRPLYADFGVRSFAVATAEAAGHRRISPNHVDGAWIDYRGPAGAFPVTPLWRLLPRAGHDRVPVAMFRDKIVVVGVTASAGGNPHQAWGRRGADMTSAEIQANALATALDDYPLRDASTIWTLLAIAALTLVAPLAALRCRPVTALTLGLLAGIGYLLVAWWRFNDGRVLSVAAPLMGLLLAMMAVALTGAVTKNRRTT